MAVRIIVKEPDPILRQISKEVHQITPNIHKLLDDMAETMYDAGGVGLAAVQVGVLKRVVVIDVGEGLIELINPVITDREGEQVGPEGCLSIPGLVGEVKRAMRCTVQALNRHGETVVITGEGFLARALQHEIDHLNGILFTDLTSVFHEPEKESD